MAKISINSHYDPATGKFSSVVIPGPVSRVEPYTSEPLFATHEDAVLAGIQSLETQGIRNINWHAVIDLLQ